MASMLSKKVKSQKMFVYSSHGKWQMVKSETQIKNIKARPYPATGAASFCCTLLVLIY